MDTLTPSTATNNDLIAPNDKGRHVHFDGWVGRTVRCVIEDPSGEDGHAVSAVVVFEDDTWSTLTAGSDDNGCDRRTWVTASSPWNASEEGISDYLSPRELLDARLINAAQFEHLVSERAKARADEHRRKAEQLRAEADRLMKLAEAMLK